MAASLRDAHSALRMHQHRRIPLKTNQGGTKVFCPSCEAIQICRVISPSEMGMESARRFHYTKHRDIQWFRRAKQCLECEGKFVTAEVEEEFLEELVELR